MNSKADLGKNFWYFRIGQSTSLFGDIFASMALAWWLLALTNSLKTVATITTISMCARLIVTPLLGPMIENSNRKHIIIMSDFLNAILYLVLAYILFVKNYNLYFIVPVFTLTGVLSSLLRTATNSFLYDIIPASKISEAIIYSSTLSSFIQIIGAAMAGILIAQTSTIVIFIINTITFMISAGVTSFVTYESKSLSSNHQKNDKVKKYFSDLKDGLIYIVSHRQVIVGLSFVLVLNVLLAPIQLIMPFLAKQHSTSPMYFSYLEIGFALGSITGGIIFSSLKKYLKNNERQLFTLGLLLMSLAFISINHLHRHLIPAVSFVLLGSSLLICGSLVMSFFNQSIKDQYRARSNSLLYLLLGPAGPVGILIGGWIGDTYGLNIMITIFSVCLMLLAVASFRLRKIQ